MRQGPTTRASLVIAGGLIAILYAPTLWLPFDFADDGCLVYPSGVSGPAEFLNHTWDTAVSELHTKGPFRPVCWLHWNLAAEAFGDRAVAHHALRLVLAWISATCLLAFFACLGLKGWP